MNIPKDLTIPAADWPNAGNLAREVARHLQETHPPAVPGAKIVEVIPENVAKAMLAMATNAWRIRAKLMDTSTGEPKEELNKEDVKKVNRYTETFYESLKSIGIEVKDRTGEAFDYGMPEKVITTEPQSGIVREIIIETIRPTIYWRNQIAQQGEVVIATPIEQQPEKGSTI